MFVPAALATAFGTGTAATAAGTAAAAFTGAKLLQKGAKALVPKVEQPPGAPQIDEASMAVQETDRLRRRRGVYANIFAGNSAAPTVGKQTLGA